MTIRAFMPAFDGDKVDEYVGEHIPDQTDGLHVLSVLREYDHDTEPWKEALKNAITSSALNAQNVGPCYQFYRSLELHDVSLLSDQEIVGLMDSVGIDDRRILRPRSHENRPSGPIPWVPEDRRSVAGH